MKLTDFLRDVGRPVAYYPKMKRITGSTTATILLCQFIYWRGKEADKTGWLYKASEEIEEETGLSYNEQKTARKQLVDAGLIDEHYARLDHQMKFKVNLEAINEKWGTLQPQIPESDDSTFGKDVMPHSLNESENTTENTTEKPPLSIENAIAVNQPVVEDEKAETERLALETFERDMQLPANWQWYPARTSDEKAMKYLRDFVVAEWQSDNQAFAKYQTWRNTPYVKGSMSNLAIKRNPEQFPVSWSDYLAHSAMYGEKQSKPENRPNYTTIEQLDEAAKCAVPRPDHIRPKSIGARR